MLIDIIMQRYGITLVNLLFDVVAILVMAYALYFRRHWRTDLLLSYVALNIGIFVMMSVLTQVRVDIATGFGLFAILSIIRLRSSGITQQEVAYYYLSLVLGLVNGLGIADHWLVLGLDILVLLVMAIFDSGRVRSRAHRMDIKLDGVFTEPAALKAEIERQLGCTVIYYEVNEVNLVGHSMALDVRVRPGAGVVLPPHDKDKDKKHGREGHEGHPDTPAAPAQAPQQPVPVGAPTDGNPGPHPHPYPHHDGVARHGG